jgi:hypothetical protein
MLVSPRWTQVGMLVTFEVMVYLADVGDLWSRTCAEGSRKWLCGELDFHVRFA